MNVIRQTGIFARWLSGLADTEGKGRILARIEAARLGNFGDSEPVGHGISEMRVHFGPGYRVYYMREGSVFYLLLCGGDKSTQQADIKRARSMAKQVKDAAKAEAESEKAVAKPKGKPSSQATGKAKSKAKKG
jgi:putative addiction module killer protein